MRREVIGWERRGGAGDCANLGLNKWSGEAGPDIWAVLDLKHQAQIVAWAKAKYTRRSLLLYFCSFHTCKRGEIPCWRPTRILGPWHSLPAPSPCSAGASPQQAAGLPAYKHPQRQGPRALLTFPLLPSTHSTPHQLQGRSSSAVVMSTARTPRPRSIPCTPVPFQQVIPVPQLAPGPLSCKSHIAHRRCLSAVKTNFTLTVQD